jgi:hypothetical protein
LGIALPDGYDQVAMSFLGALGKLAEQCRLAASGLAGHKAHQALASQRPVEKTVQSLQLALAGDKGGSLRHRASFFAVLLSPGADPARLAAMPGLYREAAWLPRCPTT